MEYSIKILSQELISLEQEIKRIIRSIIGNKDELPTELDGPIYKIDKLISELKSSIEILKNDTLC